MSRIGKKTIAIPQSVTVVSQEKEVSVKGPKGELIISLPKGISIAIEQGEIQVTRKNDEKQTRAFHGLVRSLLNNSIEGVTTGYKKTLKLVGTGYRVQAQGTGVQLAVGYSHPVSFVPESGVTVTVEGNDTIHVAGIDKHLVGQVAANIRKVRPPEVYKGKGIRYEDEVIRLKPGKTAA